MVARASQVRVCHVCVFSDIAGLRVMPGLPYQELASRFLPGLLMRASGVSPCFLLGAKSCVSLCVIVFPLRNTCARCLHDAHGAPLSFGLQWRAGFQHLTGQAHVLSTWLHAIHSCSCLVCYNDSRVLLRCARAPVNWGAIHVLTIINLF